MCALSYYLEREGIMTTGISLVRENTESMQPPRALWVTFPLGRPLGKPGDPAFQHGVIAAALALLNRESGPVLEDYPVDLDEVDEAPAAACPVSFVKPSDDRAGWAIRLERELGELAPWYELGRRRRGRTLVGVSDLGVAENASKLGSLLDDDVLPDDLTWFKHAIEDLKVYYLEALTSQPGTHDTKAVHRRFWQETDMGAALLTFFDRYQDSGDRGLQYVARMIAPREAIGRSTGPVTKEKAY